MSDLRRLVERARSVHQVLGDAIGNPGTVECGSCGARKQVDTAECLASGWPSCCGSTMTLKSRPREADE